MQPIPCDITLLEISCYSSDVFCIILLFGSQVNIGFLLLIGPGARYSEASSYLGYLVCTVRYLSGKNNCNIKQ